MDVARTHPQGFANLFAHPLVRDALVRVLFVWSQVLSHSLYDMSLLFIDRCTRTWSTFRASTRLRSPSSSSISPPISVRFRNETICYNIQQVHCRTIATSLRGTRSSRSACKSCCLQLRRTSFGASTSSYAASRPPTHSPRVLFYIFARCPPLSIVSEAALNGVVGWLE